MMNLDNAIIVAKEYTAKLNSRVDFQCRLNETPIEIGEFCYIFGYGAIDPKVELVGNAPVIIDRNNGAFITTGTARVAKFYLDNYEKRGDPHNEGGSIVELIDWDEGAQKISATLSIRNHTSLGLANSKKIIDNCLAGTSSQFETIDKNAAKRLVKELEEFNFIAKQI